MHMKIFAILLIISCTGCSKALNDLEAAFATEKPPIGNEAAVRSISITGLKKGDFTVFRDGSDVRLTPNAIRIDLPGKAPISIPASEVRGCTMVCFGGEKWNVDLLIPKAGARVSFEHSKEVYEWCWDNKLPIISGEATRNWLYLGKPLPTREALSDTVASRVAYDTQAKSACNGY